MKLYRYAAALSGIIILLWLLYDNAYLASLDPWQVDEATTLWIARNHPTSGIPVGLISSRGIPNLNGMMLYAKILAPLDEPSHISYALSCLSVLAILFLCQTVTGSLLSGLALALPSLVSITVRTTSTSLLNQYAVTPLIVAGIALMIRGIRSKREIHLGLALALFGAAICMYVASIASVIAILVSAGIVWRSSLRHHASFVLRSSLLGGILSIPLLYISVWPYLSYLNENPPALLSIAAERTLLDGLTGTTLKPILAIGEPMLLDLQQANLIPKGSAAQYLSIVAGRSALLALAMVIATLILRLERSRLSSEEHFSLFTLAATLSASFALTMINNPGVGGLRIDQLAPMTSILIIAVFAPFASESRTLQGIRSALKLLYVLTNIVISLIVHRTIQQPPNGTSTYTPRLPDHQHAAAVIAGLCNNMASSTQRTYLLDAADYWIYAYAKHYEGIYPGIYTISRSIELLLQPHLAPRCNTTQSDGLCHLTISYASELAPTLDNPSSYHLLVFHTLVGAYRISQLAGAAAPFASVPQCVSGASRHYARHQCYHSLARAKENQDGIHRQDKVAMSWPAQLASP